MFQFDAEPRVGSQCCGAVCWRGRPTTCSGPEVNDMSTGGRKLHMPPLVTVSANASTTEDPPIGLGEFLALSISSGLVLLCVVCCLLYCAKRRLSSRAVFPLDHQKKKKADEALKAGDVLADPPPEKGKKGKQGKAKAKAYTPNQVRPGSPSPPGKPGTSAPAADGVDLVERTPIQELPGAERARLDTPTNVVRLADVKLVGDASGGVWATVRSDNSPGSPMKRSVTMPALRTTPVGRSPQRIGGPVGEQGSESGPAVETDLVLETLLADARVDASRDARRLSD